jgi:hypothetical protein
VKGAIFMEVLGEIVLFRKNGFKRVRRYLRGIHPTRGVIVKGFTGWETVEEHDVVILHNFQVFDLTPSIVVFSEIPVIQGELK